MKIKKQFGYIALLTSVTLTAQAGNFNYSYGELGYETGDFDGLTLTGSFEINKDMFILARYVGVSEEVFGIDFDYTEVSVGAGYHMPIDQKTDAVLTASFVNGEVDTVGGITVDDNGVLLTAGVRHNLNPQVELAGNLYYISIFDGDFGIRGEARYNINPTMSAGLSFTSGDYLDGVGINFRLGF
mgnify:CR=1 FL=1